MPLAVTHVLTSIICVDLYRDYIARHKRYFTLHTILLAGLGGLLPDIDIPIRMILEFFGWSVPDLLHHGGITHTPFFALLLVLPGLVFWWRKKHNIAMYFFVLAFGIMLHISLDWLLGGGAYEGIMWLFPFSLEQHKVHLLRGYGDIPAAMDAVILLAWLWHEEMKHKIKDFI